MKKDEMCRENNARRVGQTHNNKRGAFSAMGFTCTGMKIFLAKNGKCAVRTRKVSLFEATGRGHA